jgi:CRP-like cAMP-binding protein
MRGCEENHVLTENFLRGKRRRELSPADVAALEAAISDVRTLLPRVVLIREGERVRESTLLIEGLMCRYMDDREGDRQLVALHLPGEFVDLHSFPLRRLDHDVATLTEVRIATVPHDRLAAIVAERPNLTSILWFSTLLDAAMHREWIFRLGRLGAAERVAHFMCETGTRLEAIGMGDVHRFRLDISQADVGEACGITPVHANRMLRQLREADLMTFRDGVVEIPDFRKLARYAEFDPAYLFLEEMDDVPAD